MKDRPSEKTPSLTPRGRDAKAARDERLAEALRANLRRRKAQSRGRDEGQVVEEAKPGPKTEK